MSKEEKNKIYRDPPQLKGLNFSKEEIKKAREANRMLMISVETSNICNLRCLYCYTDAGVKKPDEMTMEEYRSVIDQAIDLGATRIGIAGAGEPLIDPNFYKILEYTQKKGLYMILYTNATKITKELAKELFHQNITIVATMNSLKREVQNRLCGGYSWVYDKMREGLDNLLEAGFNQDSPTRVALDVFIIKECLHEIPDIFRFARKNNIFPFICRVFFLGRAKGKNLDITNNQFKELVYHLLKIDQEEFGYTWIPHPPFVASRCQLAYIHTVVGVDGNVRPCYGVFENAGNIRKQLLEEIWNSEFLLRVRNMKENIKGYCRECELIDECYGCRCRTFGLTGDLFAADPTCWKE